MAFRVSYTPVGALGQAAVAAGQARAAQAAAVQDTSIIRQQMAIRAQLSQAAMARDMRQQEMELRERAMQMQEAAAARMERTPMARRSGVSPVASAIQARLGELDKLKTSGGLPDPAYQDARLRVITGQRTPQAPQPRQLTPWQMGARERTRGREAFTTSGRLYSTIDRLIKSQQSWFAREETEGIKYGHQIGTIHRQLLTTRKRLARANAKRGEPDMENLLVLAEYATSATEFLSLMRQLPAGSLDEYEVRQLRSVLRPEVIRELAKRR